jgi:iron complex transport system ATP-binding protein
MNLEVRNATFAYNKGAPVFEDVSFTVKKGDVFCILGQNGAGKSTLLNCVGNFFKLSGGNVLLNGQDISSMNRTEIA